MLLARLLMCFSLIHDMRSPNENVGICLKVISELAGPADAVTAPSDVDPELWRNTSVIVGSEDFERTST